MAVLAGPAPGQIESIASVLEMAADKAGAAAMSCQMMDGGLALLKRAKTYRRLAEAMREPGFAGGEKPVAKPPLRTGDAILHKPTGETWTVAWADPGTGYLTWFGYPPGEAKISDCELQQAASDEWHRTALLQLKRSGGRIAEKALRLYGDPEAQA